MRPSGRGWARTWGLAVLLVVTCVGSWEALWRMRGFQPSISEDVGLWSVERDKADDGGSDAVVIIGSSRVKTGLSPEDLAEATGWRRPIQLAIDFTSPLKILEDLASDPGFRGLVIVDVAPMILFNAIWLDPLPAGYLSHRASERWSQRIETRLSVLVESTFAFRLPQLSGKHLLEAVAKGEWPAPQRFRVDGRRATHLSDSWSAGGVPIAPPKDSTVAPMSPSQFNALIVRVNRALEQIRSRGGRAVFVQMPTASPTAEFEQRLFPRALYWDVFASRVNAAAVHVDDHAELKAFVPADGSHLRSSDAAAFSRALGVVLANVLAGKETVTVLGKTEASQQAVR